MILLTGTTGYLGGHVAKKFEQKGIVHAQLQSTRLQPWRLRDELNLEQIGRSEAIIHFAWQREWSKNDPYPNVRSVGTLSSVAARMGSRFVFISSYAALAGQSHYAREKRLAEAITLENQGTVVRVGLVWGGKEGGSLGLLRNWSTRGLPWILPSHDVYVHLTHIDDLAKGLTGILDLKPGTLHHWAFPKPYAVEDIWNHASAGIERRPRALRIPGKIVTAVLSINKASKRLRVSADSAQGLLMTSMTEPLLIGTRAFRGLGEVIDEW